MSFFFGHTPNEAIQRECVVECFMFLRHMAPSLYRSIYFTTSLGKRQDCKTIRKRSRKAAACADAFYRTVKQQQTQLNRLKCGAIPESWPPAVRARGKRYGHLFSNNRLIYLLYNPPRGFVEWWRETKFFKASLLMQPGSLVAGLLHRNRIQCLPKTLQVLAGALSPLSTGEKVDRPVSG